MSTFIQYEEWSPKATSLATVEAANEIIDEYAADGYNLTLRQLYYQFVSRDLIPNTERSYKNLGALVTRARKAGLLSWTAINDNVRSLATPYYINDKGFVAYDFVERPDDLITDLKSLVNFDRWKRQEHYVEVWVEKDALSEVVRRSCRRYDVAWLACRGYLSSSEAWRAGQRFAKADQRGKECVIIHLGDHDPEGIDMTRDNDERVWLYSNCSPVHVRRIALNMDQIMEHNPPPNWAKVSSSRYEKYVMTYGEHCWELDALRPQIINDLIESAIREYIDDDTWNETLREEEEARELIVDLELRWPAVKLMLRS